MSAAEKLEELEKGVTAGEWSANAARFVPSLTVGGRHKFTSRMHSEADAQFCAAMANALPEIIAVVKALTLISDYGHELDDYQMPPKQARKIARAALSALDEALPQIGSTSPPEGAPSP